MYELFLWCYVTAILTQMIAIHLDTADLWDTGGMV